MAKTNFVHGTVVSPEYLNTMYHTGGGHVHDGGDADGHAPQIRLDLDVSGILPSKHLPDIATQKPDGYIYNLFSDTEHGNANTDSLYIFLEAGNAANDKTRLTVNFLYTPLCHLPQQFHFYKDGQDLNWLYDILERRAGIADISFQWLQPALFLDHGEAYLSPANLTWDRNRDNPPVLSLMLQSLVNNGLGQIDTVNLLDSSNSFLVDQL